MIYSKKFRWIPIWLLVQMSHQSPLLQLECIPELPIDPCFVTTVPCSSDLFLNIHLVLIYYDLLVLEPKSTHHSEQTDLVHHA
jgi:hypothetical protein